MDQENHLCSGEHWFEVEAEGTWAPAWGDAHHLAGWSFWVTRNDASTLPGMVVPGLLFWRGHYFLTPSQTPAWKMGICCAASGEGTLPVACCWPVWLRDRGAHAWHTVTNSIPPVADHLQPQLGSVAKRRACSWWSRGCLPGPGACCARWHLWHRAPVPAVRGWVAACMAWVCQASAAAFWPAEMESEFKCFASGLGLFPSL